MSGVKAIKARHEHVKVNVSEYAGLLGRACPAGVYEYVDGGVEAGASSTTPVDYMLNNLQANRFLKGKKKRLDMVVKNL